MNFSRAILLLIFTLSSYCSVLAQNDLTIRIDPMQTYGGSVSDYFESVEYIPLETSKESVFGEPRWLLITDSTIVVADVDTWSLLFFQSNGKYIRKYSLPIDAKEISQRLVIDKDFTNDNILVTSYPASTGTGEILRYSQTGMLLRKEKVKFIDGKFDSRIPLSEELYAVNTKRSISISNQKDIDTIYALKLFDSKNNFVRNLFNIIPKDNPFALAYAGGVSVSPQEKSNIAYFVVPFDYRIFRLDKNGITPFGKFVFPLSNIIPNNVIKSRDFKILDSIYKRRRSDFTLIQTVENISIFKNKVIFNIQKRASILPSDGVIHDPLNFMYDTLTKRLMAFEKIFPDSMSYYLPIMDGYSSTSGMNFHRGYVHASMSAFSMFQSMEKSKAKNPQYPSVLLDYFKTQNQKSNPVIVKMKLKSL